MKSIIAGFVGIGRELHRDLVSAPSHISRSTKPQSTLRFLFAIAGYVPDKQAIHLSRMQRHGLLATSIMPYQAPMKISTSFSLVILLASLAELHAADPPQAPAAGDSGTVENPPRNPSIETQEPVAEPPDETRAVVTIDSGAPSVRYSPMIFGGFPEHFERQIYGGVFEPGSPLADARGFRRDALAALKELKVPIPPFSPPSGPPQRLFQRQSAQSKFLAALESTLGNPGRRWSAGRTHNIDDAPMTNLKERAAHRLHGRGTYPDFGPVANPKIPANFRKHASVRPARTIR